MNGKIFRVGYYTVYANKGFLTFEPESVDIYDLQSDEDASFYALPATLSGRVGQIGSGAGLAGVTVTLSGYASYDAFFEDRTAITDILYQFAVGRIPAMIHHRVTADTEITQRLTSLRILCALCDSVVSLIQATLNRIPL